MPPERNVDRALHRSIARLSFYAGRCVEGSLVTLCDGFYLFASIEEVDALEAPDASPTRYTAAEHDGQQLSSRVSCLLYMLPQACGLFHPTWRAEQNHAFD